MLISGIGLGENTQGFVVVHDFQLTFSFPFVEVEYCRHCFRNAVSSSQQRCTGSGFQDSSPAGFSTF